MGFPKSKLKSLPNFELSKKYKASCIMRPYLIYLGISKNQGSLLSADPWVACWTLGRFNLPLSPYPKGGTLSHLAYWYSSGAFFWVFSPGIPGSPHPPPHPSFFQFFRFLTFFCPECPNAPGPPHGPPWKPPGPPLNKPGILDAPASNPGFACPDL